MTKKCIICDAELMEGYYFQTCIDCYKMTDFNLGDLYQDLALGTNYLDSKRYFEKQRQRYQKPDQEPIKQRPMFKPPHWY